MTTRQVAPRRTSNRRRKSRATGRRIPHRRSGRATLLRGGSRRIRTKYPSTTTMALCLELRCRRPGPLAASRCHGQPVYQTVRLRQQNPWVLNMITSPSKEHIASAGDMPTIRHGIRATTISTRTTTHGKGWKGRAVCSPGVPGFCATCGCRRRLPMRHDPQNVSDDFQSTEIHPLVAGTRSHRPLALRQSSHFLASRDTLPTSHSGSR